VQGALAAKRRVSLFPASATAQGVGKDEREKGDLFGRVLRGTCPAAF